MELASLEDTDPSVCGKAKAVCQREPRPNDERTTNQGRNALLNSDVKRLHLLLNLLHHRLLLLSDLILASYDVPRHLDRSDHQFSQPDLVHVKDRNRKRRYDVPLAVVPDERSCRDSVGWREGQRRRRREGRREELVRVYEKFEVLRERDRSAFGQKGRSDWMIKMSTREGLRGGRDVLCSLTECSYRTTIARLRILHPTSDHALISLSSLSLSTNQDAFHLLVLHLGPNFLSRDRLDPHSRMHPHPNTPGPSHRLTRMVRTDPQTRLCRQRSNDVPKRRG